MTVQEARRLRRRIAAGLAIAAMAGACTDGYPTKDAPAAGDMSAAEHVHALNAMLQHEARTLDARMALATPCILRLATAAQGARESTASLRLDTLHVAFSAEERYRVSVAPAAGVPAAPHHRFVVDGWQDAVAFRSHLQQLQMACVASKG
ncbi:hypothetical protein [uncultured Variovorax sp.]|uniref:hypothetical protein n=1 Tax=uncultured Variovorax sp. TaxID=114708 RepID=UPI0025E3D27E|nr:hypothetical protein [uncultured Variovorax sp.]